LITLCLLNSIAVNKIKAVVEAVTRISEDRITNGGFDITKIKAAVFLLKKMDCGECIHCAPFLRTGRYRRVYFLTLMLHLIPIHQKSLTRQRDITAINMNTHITH